MLELGLDGSDNIAYSMHAMRLRPSCGRMLPEPLQLVSRLAS
jgi:hypothetical protein